MDMTVNFGIIYAQGLTAPLSFADPAFGGLFQTDLLSELLNAHGTFLSGMDAAPGDRLLTGLFLDRDFASQDLFESGRDELIRARRIQ